MTVTPAKSLHSLNLFFPQWQGSGRLELYKGAKILREVLCEKHPFFEVPVSQSYSLDISENILGYCQIYSQLLDACQILRTHDPECIFTVGGDCGVEIAPVSFLNKRYDESLNVIWLDAHGDLNTHLSSPSAHFHGMPLRLLLGEGEKSILSHTFSTLRPEQVLLVGARDLDPPESSFIEHKNLFTVSAVEINDGNFAEITSRLIKLGSGKVYIHLDLDVIDPTDFPYVTCPTRNGVHIEKLRDLIDLLSKDFDVVGCSVLEFLPTEPHNKAASKVAELIEIIGFA